MKIFLLLGMNGYKAILLSKDYARVICFDGLFEVKKMNIFVQQNYIQTYIFEDDGFIQEQGMYYLNHFMQNLSHNEI